MIYAKHLLSNSRRKEDIEIHTILFFPELPMNMPAWMKKGVVLNQPYVSCSKWRKTRKARMLFHETIVC